MSLIKLANKLTKMYNTLSETAQQKAASLLRSEGRFVKGIEKGNRRLLSELQKRERKSFVFNDNKVELGNYVFAFKKAKPDVLMNAAKHPKTLGQAIGKRHEIFELQQILGHKGIDKKLSSKYRQFEAKNSKNSILSKQLLNEQEIIHKKELKTLNRMTSANVDPKSESYSRSLKFLKHLDARKERYKAKIPNVEWAESPHVNFYSHASPQVLANESKIMQTTPNATKTSLYKYRLNSGEIPDLKHGFNFDYFQKK